MLTNDPIVPGRATARRRRSMAATASCVVGAVLLAHACTGVRTTSEGGATFTPETFATYAFAVTPGTVVAPAELDGSIRRAIEAELGRLGLRAADEKEAKLLVSYRTEIAVRQRFPDPYFSYYAAEEYEDGTLTVELRDAVSGEVAWRGSGQSELRRSGVLVGSLAGRLTATDDPREWRVEEKMAAMFAPLRKSR